MHNHNDENVIPNDQDEEKKKFIQDRHKEKNDEDVLNYSESQVLISDLEKLVNELKEKKRSFEDRSRFYCCGIFSTCIIGLILLFYIFDVVKYQETCNKGNKPFKEICDAPSIGFWPRFAFVLIAVLFLIIGCYCTGSTVVLLEPMKNRLLINKKKLFCLPSICEYRLEDLLRASVESDSSEDTSNMTSFYFYSVTLEFKQGPDSVVNLGLGRDCFFLQEKVDLVNSINRYLLAIRS